MLLFIEVDEESVGQRVDNFLFAKYRKVPKSHIYKMIRKRAIRVNQRRVNAQYRLVLGDVVKIPNIEQPESTAVKLSPSDQWLKLIKDSVLHEDEAMVVINKPPGIAVHGGSGVPYGVIEVIRELYPQYPRIELAHRIDKDTSGCLVLAKKRQGLIALHAAFREGRVKKTYQALVKGQWSKSDTQVDAPLLRYQRSSGEKMVRVDRGDGKPSLTRFEIIRKYEKTTLIYARPHTGRTHQIRVHCQYCQHPIAGDAKYADEAFFEQMRAAGLKRMFLHAEKIKLPLADSGEFVSVTAPLSDDLKQFLNALT
jgi:23S rRNA pseudouridine955/2504/2580 synthase